jgi:hypothetical protein
MKRKSAARIRRTRLMAIKHFRERTAPRGSDAPEACYAIRGRVADSIDLERLPFGNKNSNRVLVYDGKLHSAITFWKNGKIFATGPHGLLLAMTAVAFLARTGIAPNASLASLESISASLQGRSRNANL